MAIGVKKICFIRETLEEVIGRFGLEEYFKSWPRDLDERILEDSTKTSLIYLLYK